ncbi:hypothetical protein RRF57_012107 [Xylaria bambusicola]|uniref:Uncharacterized protein n=1 Tax=Xylaria bambusicola TaxID=326684 RepID=A0AAN7Z493_9PEZI
MRRVAFGAFLANTPNFTGRYPIAGPNISTPPILTGLTDDNLIDGWSWSIATAADLLLENSSTTENQSDYYTGGKLVLNAPSSVVSGGRNLIVDNEWNLCVYHWDLANASYPEHLRNDNGTYGSILSDEGIVDMQEPALPPLNSHVCSCPQVNTIPPCKGNDDASRVFGTNCTALSFSATQLRRSGLWDEGTLEIRAFGDATTHPSGNRTAYGNIGSLAWPVKVWYGTDGYYDKASLSCVRATDTADRSNEPAGMSSTNSLDSSWTIFAAAVLSCVLMP